MTITTLKGYWFRLPEGLQIAIAYFLVTRIVFTVLGTASIKLIGHYSDAARQVVLQNIPSFSGIPFLDMWAQWDSGWYLHIAQQGYEGIPDARGQSDIAFFPLYPYLIRLLAWPFHFNATAVLIIGLLVSSVAFIVMAHFLYKLVVKKFNPQIARLSLLLLFLSPMGFIFSAVMSEALFLLLTVLAFYLAEENRWKRAGLIATLLPLIRPVGPVVVVLLFLMYLHQRRFNLRKLFKPESLWVIGPIAGGFILLVINYMVVNTPFGFLQAQTGWGRSFLELKGPSGGLFTLQGMYLLGFGLVALAVVTFYRQKIGTIYWLLALILVVIPASSGLYGLIRYTATVFPLYIALALFINSHRKWHESIIIILVLIQGVHFVWWTLGMPIMQ